MILVKDGKEGGETLLGMCHCFCMESVPFSMAQSLGAQIGGCGCGCGPTTSDMSKEMGWNPPPR